MSKEKWHCPDCEGILETLRKKDAGNKDTDNNPLFEVYFKCQKCGKQWIYNESTGVWSAQNDC